MVQQSFGGGEADVMGLGLRSLLEVVELQTSGVVRDLQHLPLPVVDGDLQVQWLQRRTEDWWKICCEKQNKNIKYDVFTYN